MIKVALIGTHATGKTTICHDLVAGLKKRGVNVEYLGEIAREAINRGFKLNEGTTQRSQRWILHTQIARELEFEERQDVEVLVCDRCVIDNYMYLINKFGYDGARDRMVNEHMKTYSHLFRVPINESYRVNDGVRSTDPIFQKRIDELLEEELKKRRILFWDYKDIESTLDIILKTRKNGEL